LLAGFVVQCINRIDLRLPGRLGVCVCSGHDKSFCLELAGDLLLPALSCLKNKPIVSDRLKASISLRAYASIADVHKKCSPESTLSTRVLNGIAESLFFGPAKAFSLGHIDSPRLALFSEGSSGPHFDFLALHSHVLYENGIDRFAVLLIRQIPKGFYGIERRSSPVAMLSDCIWHCYSLPGN
jgi:hypothetical protein